MTTTTSEEIRMSLSFEDKAEIVELHARYNRAVDTGDADAWAACFTPDGLFDARSRYARGTEALREFAHFYHQQPTYAGAVHWNANLVIDGDGDEAAAHADFALIRGSDDGVRILSTGTYASTLVRVDGCWRFTARRSTVLSADPELLALFER
jgi:uncharacterized protein (TIGR02246 family)